MSIFIPFIILSIWTYSLANFYKTNLTRAYLIVSILIIILSILFGKIGLLVFTIHSINFFSFFLLGYLLYSKKYSIYNFKKLVLFLIIYSVLVLISKDLFFYKYDEFSEYGITSKLIFTENAIPSNIDYVQKGSHHKLNLISYFHYFFLKNSTKIFQENIVYLSHSFFLIILISVILSFINEKPKKKIFIGVIFYFLIYILGPGLDRVYVDSILGLSFAIILLLYFNQNNKKSDQLLLFLLIFILPMIKPNGLLVVIGLISIFIFSFFLKRRSKNLVLVIAAFLLNFLFTEYYISDLRKYNILLSSFVDVLR